MKTKNELISELIQNYGDDVTSTEIRAYCVMKGMTFNDVVSQIEEHKVSNSKWNLNSVPEKNIPVENAIPDRGYIPAKNPNYVPFGNFSDIKKIITSGIFYPFFITGLSGNGKTMSVEQACAVLKRSMILFPVTIETDEDDLIGGFRLVNGETVFHYGPVVEAMKTGSILLLDEIDYASNKISCIQSVLAGNPLYLKKTGETIYPKKGFNIIATANTKGKGSDDGRFIGTNVLNEAFLERFAVTFEQSYPTPAIEKKILKKEADSLNLDIDPFIDKLIVWAETIRKTFYDGGIDEVITTRRLVNIIRTYAIFNNKTKAINISVARFDEETKTAFIEFYDKIDENFDKNQTDSPEGLDELLNV